MSNPPITEKPQLLIDAIKAYEQHGTIGEAARSLGLPRNTFRNRYRKAMEAGFTPERVIPNGWMPDTTIQLQRARDENARLRAQIKDLCRQSDKWSVIRENVYKMTADPIPPADIKVPKKKGKHLPEAVILHLSDLHWGEKISLTAMGGLNSYDLKIAADRLRRCFHSTVELMTDYWPRVSEPPCHLIVLLGGDMVSGDIHEELKKTNDLQIMPTVQDCQQHLGSGLRYLENNLSCPISVYCVPGNHGRTTHKPESKTYIDTNYDTMIYDTLKWHFREMGSRITFERPDSGDAVFKVFDWQMLLTHGDRIGSKGGRGFIGPAATIARGMKQVVDEYAATHVFIDWIFLGHFHTTLKLEYGYANGSLPGPSEYSRDLRSRPKAATQNFFKVHPERGITAWHEIMVGLPEEGKIYQVGRGNGLQTAA